MLDTTNNTAIQLGFHKHLNHLVGLTKCLNVLLLSYREFESPCSHLNVRYCASFEQPVP